MYCIYVLFMYFCLFTTKGRRLLSPPFNLCIYHLLFTVHSPALWLVAIVNVITITLLDASPLYWIMLLDASPLYWNAIISGVWSTPLTPTLVLVRLGVISGHRRWEFTAHGMHLAFGIWDGVSIMGNSCVWNALSFQCLCFVCIVGRDFWGLGADDFWPVEHTRLPVLEPACPL